MEEQPIEVTAISQDKIEPEMMHAYGVREGQALLEFLKDAKCPALIFAAIDTVPREDGGYNIVRSALGTQDAILQLFVWMQSEVLPAIGGECEKDRRVQAGSETGAA